MSVFTEPTCFWNWLQRRMASSVIAGEYVPFSMVTI